MIIKVVYDNRKENEAMQEGWGFSCLIDLGDRKLLFDTGADQEAFFSNLQQLGVQLEEITDLLLSHNHSDHVTGLPEVLKQLKKGTRLFLPKGFPLPAESSPIQATFVSDFAELGDQLYSFVLRGGFRLYEQALVLQTERGVVVITGCAHPGIINLLEEVQKRLGGPIYLVLGGFHLFKESGRSVSKIVEGFKSLQVERVAPCHCSGDGAIAKFQEAYGEAFYKVGTGTVIAL